MRPWRKLFVAVAGAGLVAVGIIMLVIPGPGLLTIAAGLALWATEYAWADRLLKRVKRRLRGKIGVKDYEKADS